MNKDWTEEEDHRLMTIVSSKPQPPNWSEIVQFFPLKSEIQLLNRWTKVLDPALLKGSWTRHEDETIIKFVTTNGTKSWAKLSELLPGRIGKQCRERWVNALDPSVDRGPWRPEEDTLLLKLHEQFGNHWSKISEAMPNRSDNAIKNRWHSTLSKRQKTGTPAPLHTSIGQPRAQLPSISLLPMPSFCVAFDDLPSLNAGIPLWQSSSLLTKTGLPA
jgi:hypothetical protein